MRFTLPSPYREVPHTADVGIEVEGATAEEALARAILATSQLVTAGAPCPETEKRDLRAEAEDPQTLLVSVLRHCLLPFFTDRLVPVAVETRSLDDRCWQGEVGFGVFDPAKHQGADIKAVTYAAVAFERRRDTWYARVVFDI